MDFRNVTTSDIRKELDRREKELSDANSFESHGVWVVTTEGDDEGRTTKDLGRHEGRVEDIARFLSGSACYQLSFRRADATDDPKWDTPNPVNEVNISFSDFMHLSDMPAEERAALFSNKLDVLVEPSKYYNAIRLVFNKRE